MMDWLFGRRKREAEARQYAEHLQQYQDQKAAEQRAAAIERQRLANLEWQHLKASLEPNARPKAEALIASASFKEFEHIVASLLRSEGWTADISPAGPDEGVDIQIYRELANQGLPLTGIVQVKHWPRGTVGRPVLQALAGEASVRGLRYALIATSGIFTHEARSFALEFSQGSRRMDLWSRADLEQRIDALTMADLLAMCDPLVETRATLQQKRLRLRRIIDTAPAPPICSTHQVSMGLRFYKHYFWGCPQYPDCKESQSAAGKWRRAVLAGAYPVELVGRASKKDKQRVRRVMAKRSMLKTDGSA